MRPIEFRQTRQLLQLTQDRLAEKLRTTRRSVIRYEDGSRRIPGTAEVALQHLAMDHVQMAGIVAAGEPIAQTE
jgi:DNA-binding transcriptional regulator YiaG